MGRIALFVEMAGRRCLVAGGGKAAFEKAAKLLGAGAEVTVVAPEFAPGFSRLSEYEPKTLRRERRPYAPGEAAQYDFVVAASGDGSVDRRVLEDAAAAGKLANIASRDDGGGCMFGAELRRDGVTVAISTGGASPSFAMALRDLIGEAIAPGHGLLAAAFSRIKARLRGEGYPAEARRGALRRLASPEEWVDLVDAGSVDDLEALLWTRAEAFLAEGDRGRK